MKNNWPLQILIVFLATACAYKSRYQVQSWNGHQLAELQAHPYFSKLPFKDERIDQDSWKRGYTRRGKFQTKAYCESMGGCLGLEYGDCYHTFLFKNQSIVSYERKGSCLKEDIY